MKLLKYIKNLLIDKDIQKIFFLFVLWKLLLYSVLFTSLFFLPLAGKNFLGGGIENYNHLPWIFAWANFDGEHYLSIAQIGYKGLEQAFFPIYPILIHLLAIPFGVNLLYLTISGIIISNMALLIGLIILFKLINLDYSREIAFLTIILMLIFPTSFFFGAVYSESLFLLLTVSSFYFFRQKKLAITSFLGIVSSATRIFGVLLLPVFLIEAWQNKEINLKLVWLLLIPLGLLGYMYYQWVNFGDPLAFYHLQKIVGPQHESGITLIPQVYIRYIKMILTTDITNPIFQTIVLEFFVGILFFILPIYGYFKKMRLSYIFFALIGFLLPTIQGSFSSVPRYVIILFPSFIVISLILNKLKLSLKVIVILISICLLILETAFFFRGYWVA